MSSVIIRQEEYETLNATVMTLLSQLAAVTAERDALLEIIKNYYKETNWILPSYKAPPHIKALFDAAKGDRVKASYIACK